MFLKRECKTIVNLLTMFSKNDEGGLFPLDAFFVGITHLRPNRTNAEPWEEGDGFE